MLGPRGTQQLTPTPLGPGSEPRKPVECLNSPVSRCPRSPEPRALRPSFDLHASLSTLPPPLPRSLNTLSASLVAAPPRAHFFTPARHADSHTCRTRWGFLLHPRPMAETLPGLSCASDSYFPVSLKDFAELTLGTFLSSRFTRKTAGTHRKRSKLSSAGPALSALLPPPRHPFFLCPCSGGGPLCALQVAYRQRPRRLGPGALLSAPSSPSSPSVHPGLS